MRICVSGKLSRWHHALNGIILFNQVSLKPERQCKSARQQTSRYSTVSSTVLLSSASNLSSYSGNKKLRSSPADLVELPENCHNVRMCSSIGNPLHLTENAAHQQRIVNIAWQWPIVKALCVQLNMVMNNGTWAD